MAHFAEILENNIVGRVLVVPDSEEHRGQEFLNDDIGLPGRWIQTSYNNKIRKIFAAPGYEYLEDVDAFKLPKPEGYPSFIFDEDSWSWIPPVEYPEDGKIYAWDEGSTSWVEVRVELASSPDADEEVIEE
jgi:hypothetical protein